MSFKSFHGAGRDAVSQWEVHRNQFAVTGLYPFIIGSKDEWERLVEGEFTDSRQTAEILQGSLRVKPTAWIAKQRIKGEKYAIAEGGREQELLGTWPGENANKGSMSLHLDLHTHKPLKEVYFGLAEIEYPWQLPASIPFGNWNACPAPEVHCAIYRYWADQHGVEITGISTDTVECRVTKPPRSCKAALALAWEQYWYCGDIVDQGCGSISNLAATLINSHYWFFWWD